MTIAIEVSRTPLAVTLRRDGHRLLGPIVPRIRDGAIEDQFIQLTEGVIAQESLGDPLPGLAQIDVTNRAPSTS